MTRRSVTPRLRRWGVFLLGEVRTGLRRVRGSFVPIAQAAVAAEALGDQVWGKFPFAGKTHPASQPGQ